MTIFTHYKYELCFAVILTATVALSMWASRFIPGEYFDGAITPILMSASTAIAFCCAWITFRHTEGDRARLVWGWTLVLWGVLDGIYVVSWLFMGKPVMNMGAYKLTTMELALGNLLGWSLLLFPTEALRPGWMNPRRAMYQVLPMFALVALDYFLPFSLRIIIALYPAFLLALLFTHIREYKIWCEDNFSSLEDFDEKSVMRYMCIGLLVGAEYLNICVSHSPARGFTQQWLVIFALTYGTDLVLFRRDPWEQILQSIKNNTSEEENQTQPNEEYRRTLEEWMEKEKPYRNPDFKLVDLQSVLPMNRTYLSQFIHAEYDCSFYLFVNRYRIEEAKRLMSENPELKMADISSCCGFSSPSVFSRTFMTITGQSPSEWDK
ncbi:MAG: AraC family transcriptional regulator [Bacteroidales bacterium]|nr:AraC family transcriptional regulator [Bacteroidales bacterium]